MGGNARGAMSVLLRITARNGEEHRVLYGRESCWNVRAESPKGAAVRRVFSWATVVLIYVSMVAPFAGGVSPAMAASGAAPAGFVNGPWLVVVQQAAIDSEFADLKLAAKAGSDWLVVVADVTNTGSDGTFSVGDLGLGTLDGGTVGAAAPDEVVSASAFGASKVDAGNTVAIADSQTARVVLAWSSKDVSAKDAALVLEDQKLPLKSTIDSALDASALDKPTPLAIEQAALVEANGVNLSVTTSAGTTSTVLLAGLAMPGSGGCFGPEAAAAVANLTGGTLWLQKDANGKGNLVWYWDAAKGGLVLLNQTLVEQGFAGTLSGSASSIAPWLGLLEAEAESAGTGLWALCRDAVGTWIKEPTPDPSQVRAQYQAIDARDLVIRPTEFTNEKIVVTGTVFNIQVEGNVTFMQIWLDGTNMEAAVIGYEGDSRGIYEGTWITVYGVGRGTFEGTNAYGAAIVQPLIRADYVDF